MGFGGRGGVFGNYFFGGGFFGFGRMEVFIGLIEEVERSEMIIGR